MSVEVDGWPRRVVRLPCPRAGRACAAGLALLLIAVVGPAGARAQEAPEPVLRGRVLVGDTTLATGTVVLHEITDVAQGELDSIPVGPDGGFRFLLPTVPDGSEEHFYFVSVRHAGILYFGNAITRAAQLDSIYEIQTYDTLMASPGGMEIPIQARNVFFEPAGETWRVTDIFQLRNDEDRTLVAPEGDRVWSYPLFPGASDFSSGQGELSLEGTGFENDTVSVRAAIPPGERVFVFRYTVDEPFGTLPTPGVTEMFDLLVREPSPRVGVEGLELVGRVEVEAGSTYRRYSGEQVGPGTVRIIESELPGDLPMEWITVLVGLALAAAALVVVGRRSDPEPHHASGGDGHGARGAARPRGARREHLLLEVARLDEAFESDGAPTDDEAATYRARRAALLDELRSL